MSTKTTRSCQSTEKTGNLYLAFELSNSTWKLGFSIGLGQRVRERNVPAGELEKLQAEIGAAKRRFGLDAAASVRSCYEAGRDGFWLHRYLVEQGIENLIVDSSSIEVDRRARRAKSDRLDVQKLVSMLIRHHSGEPKMWSVVRVPSVEEEDRRQLHRELKGLKKERTRGINRIRGLLASQGVRVTLRQGAPADWLEQSRLWDGSELPPGMKDRLRREWEHLQYLGNQISAVEGERRKLLRAAREQKRPDIEQVERLVKLRAIGLNGAWILVEEFFGWRKFKNRREVGGLAGLTGTPYNSGDTTRELGISKAGNRYVRGVVVELAWAWLRYQPRSKLARWYNRRFGNGSSRLRKIGIVALARRLLIDLWRYLESGVVPEGARLKD
jgi:transposase